MNDLTYTNERSTWLSGLKVGDCVSFCLLTKRKPAEIYLIEKDKIWFQTDKKDGSYICSWVFRDTGNCPAARSYIEPLKES